MSIDGLLKTMMMQNNKREHKTDYYKISLLVDIVSTFRPCWF